MNWATREKAKVDRVACPWRIRKFVDPQAEFLLPTTVSSWNERSQYMKPTMVMLVGCVLASLGGTGTGGYAADHPSNALVASFDNAPAGQPPAGFTEALTAGGGPVKWRVVETNDRKLFEVENDTFTAAGKVGLWTKADSVTYFDDLKITSLDHD
jgi:hypothetical protein